MVKRQWDSFHARQTVPLKLTAFYSEMAGSEAKPESSDCCLHGYKTQGNLDRLPSSAGSGQQVNPHCMGWLTAATLGGGIHSGINNVDFVDVTDGEHCNIFISDPWKISKA